MRSSSRSNNYMAIQPSNKLPLQRTWLSSHHPTMRSSSCSNNYMAIQPSNKLPLQRTWLSSHQAILLFSQQHKNGCPAIQHDYSIDFSILAIQLSNRSFWPPSHQSDNFKHVPNQALIFVSSLLCNPISS